MPGEREIADMIDMYLPNFGGSLPAARAILALFAPILAERDGWVTHWQTKCQATRTLELAAEARALAAEAALAAERERCAKIAEKVGQCANTSGRGQADERFAEDIATAIRAQGE